jgi:predicted ferric reductase
LIVGVIHTYRVDILMQHTPVVNLYVRVLSYAGVALYLYKELLQPLVQRGRAYVVSDARRLNGTVLEVTLRPEQQKLSHRPGQFLFVRFGGDKVLGESHPFSISSAPAGDELKLAVRASGDFTQYMYDHLKPGTAARVDGGYGLFDYRLGGPRQIWVAGGIGVTPFLSWIRDFDGRGEREIDFFYSVRAENDALYEDEIRQAQARQPSFCAHVFYTNRDGHLTVDKIAEISGGVAGREIYLCGPYVMTEALTHGFRKLGAQANKIHYEEFNFR